MHHEPLFSAGLHAVDEADLGNHFSSNFPNSATRPKLIVGLIQFISRLKDIGIKFELWLDGSFATEKVDPNDIDLVVFASIPDVNSLDKAKQLELQLLFGDRISTKTKFGCDAFFVPIERSADRSYWRGWYGFDRNENPKGIPKLVLEP